MILTEKEAATKACVREPHASYSGNPTFPCRGSLCMGWRVSSKAGDMLPNGVSLGLGYCGLAGSP